MNARYSIRREPQGLTLPFGAGGVAAAGAVALGIVGLLVPIAWLETISFQLYLDSITAAAEPPLGTTARIAAALALALFGALLGYVLAKAFGVVASDFSLADLIARLRGTGEQDEEDAPELRAADRHPDAPARRPFSAARDIPARDWDDGEWRTDPATGDEDGDELVLDAQFEPLVEDDAVIAVAPESTVDRPVEIFEHEPVAWSQAHESIEDYDLQPPDPADWEVAAAVEPDSVEPENARVDAVDRGATSEVSDAHIAGPGAIHVRPAAIAQSPLDLSVARLDELLARLEAGLTRKSQTMARPAVENGRSETVASDAGYVAPSTDADPAFLQDPALAAALATLRKMNLRAG
jgi:hypothetical protein